VLSFAPHLYVEDGAVGSSRATELRVRVVTDSPAHALAYKTLLHKIPLYAPEAFPRTITVYVATLAQGEQQPYVVVDIESNRATVLAVGHASVTAVKDAVSFAAARLMTAGGYRHVAGGDLNSPNLAEARADGVLDWYLRDGHHYAAATDPHPDILALPHAVVVSGQDGKGASLVLSSSAKDLGEVSALAAKAGRLASSGAVWHASEGLSSMWAGHVTGQTAAESFATAQAGVSFNGGESVVSVPSSSALRSSGHPTQVYLLGGSTDAASLAKALGLNEKSSAQLSQRFSVLKDKAQPVGAAADLAGKLGLTSNAGGKDSGNSSGAAQNKA
jgi:hypothetical protein